MYNEIFTRYDVDRNGNVYSIHSGEKIKLSNGRKNRKGYLRKNLYLKDGKKVTILVHRLVAYKFIKRNDHRKTSVDHIVPIKDDNRVANLRWMTPKENSKKGNKCLI